MRTIIFLFLFGGLFLQSCSNDNPFVQTPLGDDAPFYIPYFESDFDTSFMNAKMRDWECVYRDDSTSSSTFSHIRLYHKDHSYVYYNLSSELSFVDLYLQNHDKVPAEILSYVKKHYGKPKLTTSDTWYFWQLDPVRTFRLLINDEIPGYDMPKQNHLNLRWRFPLDKIATE